MQRKNTTTDHENIFILPIFSTYTMEKMLDFNVIFNIIQKHNNFLFDLFWKLLYFCFMILIVVLQLMC